MSTWKVKPDPGSLDRQHRRQRRRAVGMKVGAFAVVAAIGLAACSGTGDSPGGENATAPADEPTAVTPADTAAVEVATGFIDAYGTFEVEQAITYLADDADISGLIATAGAQGDEGALEQLRLLISLLGAQGYRQTRGSCEEVGDLASGTAVRCAFDFHLFGSQEFGRGPFSGSFFDLTVRDGEVVRASVTWEIGEFSPQMWEPFAKWVSRAHPEDATVMYTDEGYTLARLTEESIRLWEQRTREYVGLQNSAKVRIAERFMVARNGYDVETALSLLAKNGATILLTDNNVIARYMPTLRLDRDELALALEAERLFQVRYESVECRPDPVLQGWSEAQISCSFRMDNRLRQIEGYTPKPTSIGIGVQGGRVTILSFPWLNVGFPAGNPAEGASFVEWVEATHPEVGGIQGGFHDGELFRIMGQEVVLILTPDSIDLLARYLDEYERSVSG